MKISDMTIEELKDLISQAVEAKLQEALGDPDWGLELRDDMKERLSHSLEAVEKGEGGISLEEAISKLDLEH